MLTAAVTALLAPPPLPQTQVVSEVLERCGEDVEAAVAQLSSLELATAPVAQQQAQAQQQQDAQQQVGSEGGVQEGAPASGVDVHAHEHSEVAGPSGLAKATAAGLPDPSSPEWVDGLVSEMSAAADLDDAKRRAARVLQTFATAVASAGGDAENARLCTQIDDLARENSILKRAVATLHNRHHEMFKEAGQVGDLKRLVAHQQEQLKQAEISNYTLQMHLRQAADGGGGGEKHNRRGPDVF